MTIGTEGMIHRKSDGVVVRMVGQAHLLEQAGVVCENPDSPEEERIYAKTFVNKRIFLPDQFEQAKAEILGSDNQLILGMTGYSSIKPKDCADWGIKPGAYEAACEDILGTVIRGLRKTFPGTTIKLFDGASDMGVDRALINVARKLNIEHLGFSCPKFMFYVNDDDDAVYVANSQKEYSDAFIRELDILYSVGGRMQALEHDMIAAIVYNKRLVPLEVLKAISTNGGPPARDADGKVLDATAAFYQAIHMQSRGKYSNDPYADLRCHALEVTESIARGILPPESAFGSWLP